VTWLAYGVGLGLGVGIIPGPLLALVLANSLRGGLRSGVITSLAPLPTDVVIIALSLTLMDVMPVRMVALLGAAGGMVVIGIAVDAFLVTRRDDPVPQSAAMRRAFSESARVYLLSPFPWLFWLTAGGALLSTAYTESPSHALWFLVGFYALLIGVTLGCSRVVSATGRRLAPEVYRRGLLVGGSVLALTGALVVVHFLPVVVDVSNA
jgi:threonine/homoserine/homoserine lactone efflux protein